MAQLTLARHRSPALVAAGLALLTVAGCGPKIRLSDSVDSRFDLIVTHPYDDRLSSPYVAGAQFAIFAYDISENVDLDGWTIVSLDPDVLDVTSVEIIQDDIEDDDHHEEDDVIRAEVIATGPGTATLEVHDDRGNFVRATEVEVKQPDRLELFASGPMFIERDDLAGPIDSMPLILANGTATFLVRWFAGDERLSGAGALGLASDHTQINSLWERQSYLDEDRDWATISFEFPEEGNELATIDFLANGETVDSVTFMIVQPGDIDRVELLDEATGNADEGELLTVLAQALDVDDQPIWGVEFDWDIDGDREPGEGDLFRYWFDPTASSILAAEYDGHRGETLIQGNEGFVASSNDIGCFCSTDASTQPGGAALGLLVLASLGLVRRRRD